MYYTITNFYQTNLSKLRICSLFNLLKAHTQQTPISLGFYNRINLCLKQTINLCIRGIYLHILHQSLLVM